MAELPGWPMYDNGDVVQSAESSRDLGEPLGYQPRRIASENALCTSAFPVQNDHSLLTINLTESKMIRATLLIAVAATLSTAAA